MTVCVTTNYLDPSSVYPVLDPRRTPGPGPYRYGYALAWDGIMITVARTPALSSCQMTIVFSSTLTEGKEIQAWNLFNNSFADRIGSAGLGLASSMNIRRAWGPGRACGAGTDTLVLCRYFAWPRGRTALYSFPAQDFWDFWGGCTVTFSWFSDTAGSGRWGNQTPEPVYPLVAFPDRTLMRDGAGFRVVFGGTDFVADDLLVINGIRYFRMRSVPSPPFPRPTSRHPGGRHGATRMEPSRGVRRLRRCEVLDSGPADAVRTWLRLESCRCHSPGWHSEVAARFR